MLPAPSNMSLEWLRVCRVAEENQHMQISLSQIQTWRDCQQKYYYNYVLGLRKREAETPLEFGSMIHSYLERYYTGLKNGEAADEAHETAFAEVDREWFPRLRDLADLSYAVGGEETATELLSMEERARYIMERYYAVRGQSDAEKWEILLVEQPLKVRIGNHTSLGKADLVFRERSSGLIYLNEHKTAKRVPSDGYRLRDLQTVLYAEELRLITGIVIQGIHWNYIRTKPPEIPEQLKNGTFTKRQIDTTWDVYKKAVEDAGQDYRAYDDMRIRLQDKEPEVQFPRFDYLIMGDRGLFIRDFKASVQEIAQARKDWEEGVRQPVRHLNFSCDFCTYNKLCTAAVAFGGTDEIMRLHFTTREQRRAEEVELV